MERITDKILIILFMIYLMLTQNYTTTWGWIIGIIATIGGVLTGIILVRLIIKGGAMARNYGNEMNWAAKKYGRLQAQIEKELVDAFREKLKAEGVGYTEWLRERIKEYLKSH